MAKSQMNYISPQILFCFSKKRPSWLFTSFFNSDTKSYLQIHKSLPSLKMCPDVCTQAHVRIVFARHFRSRCHGRVKCNFFNIVGRSYNKVPPLTWHENYDRNYPSRFVICRSCSRWRFCSYETTFFHRANKVCISLTCLYFFKNIITQFIICFKARSSFFYLKRFFVCLLKYLMMNDTYK